MEFKQLQSFVEVVKYGSFTKAADHLYLSQPTISAHIRQLEEELGKRLILRTTKSIEITPKGREVYEYATNILELKDRMVECCSVNSQEIIHLGASTIPSAYILPKLLAGFGEKHPGVFFAIHQSDSRGIAGSLKEGLFDIGMVGMMIEDEQIECIPFREDHMVLITPVNDHFLKMLEQPEIPLKELLQEPIIMRENGSGSQKTANHFLESQGLSEQELRIVARINDQEAIKNLVAGGLGVSIISELAARNFISERRILSFDLSAYSSKRNLYLIYRKDYLLKPGVKKFLAYVKNEGGR